MAELSAQFLPHVNVKFVLKSDQSCEQPLGWEHKATMYMRLLGVVWYSAIICSQNFYLFITMILIYYATCNVTGRISMVLSFHFGKIYPTMQKSQVQLLLRA